MKKRIACVLLTLIMLVSLVPTAALTASAATNAVSEAMIEVIKQREGFSEKAYWDNSQWSIGYGTKSEEGATITKEEAEEALLEELATVDAAVNQFASSKGLSFSQSKHDALVSFTYNCGSGWMDGGRFCDAVVKGASGNDFLFAIALWSNSGGSINKGLLDRRLAEANTYLNGVYAVSRPSNYAYVIFDANGGSVGEEKVQGYDSSTKDGAAIKVTPVLEGYRFDGWYTEKDGGTQVTALDASTAGKTLYAQWSKVIATVTVTNSYINVREKATATSNNVGKVYQGDTLVLVEVSEDGKWGRFEDGWVALEYTNYKDVIAGKAEDKEEDKKDDETEDEETVEETVIATGTVANCTTLKIREKASTTSAQVGSLNNGTKVSIYEITEAVNGHDWGRIDKGWICLTYVNLDGAAEDVPEEDQKETVTSATTTIATVNSKDGLNVRKEADVDSAVVETLKDGAEVTITLTKTVNGQEWGQVKNGWILMSLVTVKEVITNYRLGYVDNTDKVNVRAAAGTTNALVGSLTRGTEVKIYDETTKNGVKWYKIDQGWVCGNYITLADASDDSSSDDDNTVSGDVIAVGLVNSSINLNVRKGPATTYDKVTSLPTGTRINIYEITKTNGIEWGKTEDGWVCMTYVTVIASNGSSSDEEAPSGEGTTGTVVNCSTAVNIRAAAGVNNALVGTAALGSTVTIYETTTVNGVEWGRMDRGWVCMTYIRLEVTTGGNTSGDNNTSGDTSTGGSTNTEGAQTGTIANTEKVNVRAAAGVRNALVTTLARGTKVNVYEQVTKDGAAWGRIDQGWVAMQYVALDATTGGTASGGNSSGSSTETAIGTGYVNSSVDLNVRTGPGLGYAKITSLKRGTQVNVYEQLTSDGMIWGRIDQGWVCMSYVTMTSTVSTGKGVMGTIARCGNAVNVRSAPGTGNALVGTILVGSRVEILEIKNYNGQDWGRVTQGWISMYYVLLDSELPPAGEFENGDSTNTGTGDNTNTEETEFDYADVIASGTVTYAEGANVRQEPNGTVVTTLANGTQVLITEQKTDDDKQVWGKTEKGWVLMSRITVDAEVTGTVQAETNVRKGPGTDYEVEKTLKAGDKVTVIAQVTVNSDKWGKTEDGWILMASVKAGEAESDEDEETEDKSEETEDKTEDTAEGKSEETEDTTEGKTEDTTEEKTEGTEEKSEGTEDETEEGSEEGTDNQNVDWE